MELKREAGESVAEVARLLIVLNGIETKVRIRITNNPIILLIVLNGIETKDRADEEGGC